MLFCSGRQGTASYSPDVVGTDLTPLFETILEYIPAPEADVDQPFQMLVSSSLWAASPSAALSGAP